MEVGLIGLGLMGQAMIHKLLDKSHRVHLYNRTKTSAALFLDKGAIWENTPRELATKSEVILSIVKDPVAVRNIALGEDGVLTGMGEDSVFADMSTVSPKWAEELATLAMGKRLRFVQAPVLGSVPQINSEKLLVFAGGDIEDVNQAKSVWNAFSLKTWHMGKPAQSAGVKLACNMLVAHMTLGLGQSIIFTRKNGVDPSVFLDILSHSILGCGLFEGKGKLIQSNDYSPSFTLGNMLKDLNLVQETALEENLPLPINSLIRELFISAVSQGYGDEDYSAAVKILERLAK